MRTIRLAWPSGLAAETEGEIFLEAEQARHGALVLRLLPGAAVEITGACGLAPAIVSTVEFSGRFSRKNPGLAVKLVGPWKYIENSGPRLALALIQGQRFDWAVEKSVELGASQLMPIICERCKISDARPGQAKQERWHRLAEEARKQCGRANRMEIFPPQTATELLTKPGPGFFLSPTAQPSALNYARPDYSSPLFAVGPEGGFTEKEERAFSEAGYAPLNLGSITLRAETAAIAALAIFLYRRG